MQDTEYGNTIDNNTLFKLFNKIGVQIDESNIFRNPYTLKYAFVECNNIAYYVYVESSKDINYGIPSYGINRGNIYSGGTTGDPLDDSTALRNNDRDTYYTSEYHPDIAYYLTLYAIVRVQNGNKHIIEMDNGKTCILDK